MASFLIGMKKKQRYDEGGTAYLSKQEFNETVKSFREVF